MKFLEKYMVTLKGGGMFSGNKEKSSCQKTIDTLKKKHRLK